MELHLPLSNTSGDAEALLSGSGGVLGNLLSGVEGVIGIRSSDTCDAGICGIMGVISSVWVTTLNLPRFTAVVVIGLSFVSEFKEA